MNESRDYVLIFGDEVESAGHINSDGWEKVSYRKRDGWVKATKLAKKPPLEIYFIDVGQGDSTFIITPKRKTILVDGGKGNEAFQFLVWKYRLDAPNAVPITIDLLVLSHADEDHIKGLVSIIQHPLINVKKVIHNGIARYRSGYDTELGNIANDEYLVTSHNLISELNRNELKKNMQLWYDAIINEANVAYNRVDSKSPAINIGDPAVKISVLGPVVANIPNQVNPVFKWFKSVSKTINAHSVILKIELNDVVMLLPGDINTEGAEYLLEVSSNSSIFNSHVLKAPHHGSNHYLRDFLKEVKPQISVISSGETPDHGHPRADFLGTIGGVSRSTKPLVFSTELVAQFVVDKDAEQPDADDDVDPTDPHKLGQARRRFKKRLNGLVNIRTDGNNIYCARRVSASYQFVTYKVKPE